MCAPAPVGRAPVVLGEALRFVVVRALLHFDFKQILHLADVGKAAVQSLAQELPHYFLLVEDVP